MGRHQHFTALFSLLQSETGEEEFTYQPTGHLGREELGLKESTSWQRSGRDS